MATETLSATAENTRPGFRLARGEWRPPYPCTYAPIFKWPFKPLAILKWLFNWPGFLWPTNLSLLLISIVCWRWFTPDISRCAHFQRDWITLILLRNLALTWIIYGGFHLFLHTLKVDGINGKYDPRWPAKNSRTFLFGSQVYDNIFWTSVVALLIWTAYEALTLWAFANKIIPSFTYADHPVWFVVWIIAIPFWREFHFYWIHRLIHWKPMYKYVHYLHHKNINPISWSGMAMHPVETTLYLSVVMIHWIIPSHPFHFLFDLQHAALGPAYGHHGFEAPIIKGKLPIGSYFHYLHHRYFECNYGEATIPLDKLFGTFRDGLPEGAGSNLQEEHKL